MKISIIINLFLCPYFSQEQLVFNPIVCLTLKMSIIRIKMHEDVVSFRRL